MDKGCPILRHAYIIAQALESKDTVVHPDIKGTRCMETYCALWVEGKGCSLADIKHYEG